MMMYLQNTVIGTAGKSIKYLGTRTQPIKKTSKILPEDTTCKSSSTAVKPVCVNKILQYSVMEYQ
jgi:hypothetical protein